MPFAIDVDTEWTDLEIGFRDRAVHVFGAELFGLLLHFLDQIRTVDAARKRREIFYGSGKRELASGLMPDHDQRVQVGSAGVNCRCVSGASGAENDDITHTIS